ncbi:MAG: hypothetical protein KZQ73_03690 [Candidatus Thiodiazotropha sp. (ex Semelilucina semeliformis)]|nr:hypothetical protein [Candidatus Thiodiazotropha sp. (ex Semelilucina semeliformis)]MCU7830014.1 hypothetical protein [Candidatus Thiodiazotropha sp. (ex Myrtea sp. 'scaly one' KF741663)]
MTSSQRGHTNRLSAWPKAIYRKLKWQYLNAISRGSINEVILIDPCAIEYGQKPESQFPPKKFLGGYEDGDWDQQVIPVESHLLYQSYIQHFLNGEPWKSTPFFNFALESIKKGVPFRGEYDSVEKLKQRFEKCDHLYFTIKRDGYKSNHQLYDEGKIDNKLDLLDEISVNRARDGSIILNDGWHRFASARLLKISSIPARLCAKHTLSRKP